jgi:hypothetical protein
MSKTPFIKNQRYYIIAKAQKHKKTPVIASHWEDPIIHYKNFAEL